MDGVADSGDFSKLKLLDPYLAAYKKTVSFLKTGAVPEEYAGLHLELLNSMHNTALAVGNMKRLEGDPALALIGTQLYIKESVRMGAYLSNLKLQAQKDAVKFSGKDGGSFFNQYFEKIL